MRGANGQFKRAPVVLAWGEKKGKKNFARFKNKKKKVLYTGK